MFSPRIFLSSVGGGGGGGGTGIRARRWEKCLGLLTFCYYCLCTHSSPLGKEVKQELNLSGRKTKKKK